MLSADIHPVDILLLWAASENDTPKVAELLRAGADASAKVLQCSHPRQLETDSCHHSHLFCDTAQIHLPSTSDGCLQKSASIMLHDHVLVCMTLTKPVLVPHTEPGGQDAAGAGDDGGGAEPAAGSGVGQVVRSVSC